MNLVIKSKTNKENQQKYYNPTSLHPLIISACAILRAKKCPQLINSERIISMYIQVHVYE